MRSLQSRNASHVERTLEIADMSMLIQQAEFDEEIEFPQSGILGFLFV